MKKYKGIMLLFLIPFITSCTKVNLNNYIVKESANPIKTTYKDFEDENYQSFKYKLDEAMLNIFSKFYETNKVDNFIISPTSIINALIMNLPISKDSLKEEILDSIDVNIDLIEKYYPLFYSSLNEEDYNDDKKISELINKNSIWLNNNYVFKEDALNKLASNYFTSSYSLDFNNKDTNKILDAYIKEATNGLLNGKNIPSLSNETAFIILNTLYLKDVWLRFGGELNFTKEPISFLNKDKTVKNIKMLDGIYEPGLAIENDKYKSFYARTSNGYKLTFIVPNNSYSLDEILNYETIKECAFHPTYKEVDHDLKEEYYTKIIFPKFESHYFNNITNFLIEELNLKSFKNESYLFKDLIDIENVNVSIIHEAKIKVDEIGIEGASYTAEVVATSPEPIYKKIYKTMTIDKEFAYIVSDYQYTPLFTGIISSL